MNVTPAFGRGQTFYGATNTIPSSFAAASTSLEGVEHKFEDLDWSATTTGPKKLLSGMQVTARLVRNASAAALTPGKLVKYKASYYGKRVEITGTADEACAGIVDPALPSAGVRVGDLFWMITRGPTLVAKTTGGGTDHAQGTRLTTNNAGLAQAAATGTPADSTAAALKGFDLATNTVGRVITAPATSDSTVRIFADLRFS